MWYTVFDEPSQGVVWGGKLVASTLVAYLLQEIAKRGWNPTTFARKAGIPITTLNYILNTPAARPMPPTLRKLAAALDIEEAELTSKIGYVTDRTTPLDADHVRLARAIADRPWIAARKELILSLSQEEFDDLMDEFEVRQEKRRGRRGHNSR